MTQEHHSHLVGIFHNRHSIHQAILALQSSSVLPEKIRICTRDPLSDQCIGGVEVKAQPEPDAFWGNAKSGAVTGGIGSGLLGLTQGISLSAGAAPGLGAIALSAHILGTITAATLIGIAVGTVGGSVLGALVSWGVPHRSGSFAEEMQALAPGDYLLLLSGSEADAVQARDILSQRSSRQETK
ncbi:MAG: hypothetical protein VKK04_06305 [Synechococcales bacterium]|nr:hypothetical protein [Synechococcales bacterium]